MLSKLLERLVAKQLLDHLRASRLLPELQSAYQAYHSKEAIDSGDLAVLTLLDLSVAFDTVNHVTILRRLQVSYGLGGNVIAWFMSYLGGRTRYVCSGVSRSTSKLVSTVSCGAPQG